MARISLRGRNRESRAIRSHGRRAAHRTRSRNAKSDEIGWISEDELINHVGERVWRVTATGGRSLEWYYLSRDPAIEQFDDKVERFGRGYPASMQMEEALEEVQRTHSRWSVRLESVPVTLYRPGVVELDNWYNLPGYMEEDFVNELDWLEDAVDAENLCEDIRRGACRHD